MKEHIIEQVEGKQPPYKPIYTFNPVELETLKSYIETHLKTRFIWPFESPVGDPILFHKKHNGSFYLYVNYQGLNNLTIKNWYLFPLIGKALDQLS